MKCNEPYPQGSYEECRLDLGHRGDHEYFDTKWSRPEPARPNEDVEAILDRADHETRAWGTEDRSYPVIIERTQVYVYWVDAETEDKALLYVNNNCWEISLDKEQPVNGWDEVRRVDDMERRDAFSNEQCGFIGPRIACPDCGNLSMRREWNHNPLRKCHGSIEWIEVTAPISPRYQWRRKHEAHAGAVAA